MQEVKIEDQERRYINRVEVLNKAVDVARKLHEAAIWVVRQQIPLTDSEIMPGFYIEWLKTEVRRLWGIEIIREEAEYLWLKSVVGF
jgi:uncharacterized protein (DUF2384 family)